METHIHIIRQHRIGLFSAAIAALSLPVQAEAQFTGPGTYRIWVEGVAPAQRLEIANSSMLPGAPLLRGAPSFGKKQKFRIVAADAGGYFIRPLHSKQCLDLTLGATTIGTPVIQFVCNNAISERFYISNLDSGGSKIRSAKANRILYVPLDENCVRLAANAGDPPVGKRFRFQRL